MIITVPTLQMRPVTINRIELDDSLAVDVDELFVDVLDQIQVVDTGATVVDGTIRIPIDGGPVTVRLAAGTDCRYRIRGLPITKRTVTVPAGTDPIALDELPDALTGLPEVTA